MRTRRFGFILLLLLVALAGWAAELEVVPSQLLIDDFEADEIGSWWVSNTEEYSE